MSESPMFERDLARLIGGLRGGARPARSPHRRPAKPSRRPLRRPPPAYALSEDGAELALVWGEGPADAGGARSGAGAGRTAARCCRWSARVAAWAASSQTVWHDQAGTDARPHRGRHRRPGGRGVAAVGERRRRLGHARPAHRPAQPPRLSERARARAGASQAHRPEPGRLGRRPGRPGRIQPAPRRRRGRPRAAAAAEAPGPPASAATTASAGWTRTSSRWCCRASPPSRRRRLSAGYPRRSRPRSAGDGDHALGRRGRLPRTRRHSGRAGAAGRGRAARRPERQGGGRIMAWSGGAGRARRPSGATSSARSARSRRAAATPPPSRAVSDYAGHIAGALGLDPDRVDRVRLAAFLYDATAPGGDAEQRARIAARVTANAPRRRGRGVAAGRARTGRGGAAGARVMAVAEAFVAAGGQVPTPTPGGRLRSFGSAPAPTSTRLPARAGTAAGRAADRRALGLLPRCVLRRAAIAASGRAWARARRRDRPGETRRCRLASAPGAAAEQHHECDQPDQEQHSPTPRR